MAKPRALITGSSGLLGVAIAEELSRNDWDCTGTIHFSKPFGAACFTPKFCDVSDAQQFRSLGVFDLAVHAAAVQPQRIESYLHAQRVNVDPIATLAEMTNGNVITFSSTSVSVSENLSGPAGWYAQSKVLLERVLRETEVGVALRLPSVVGKHANGGIVYELSKAALSDEDIQLFWMGERLRSLIHVRDIAVFVGRIANNGAAQRMGATFDIAGMEPVPLVDIARHIVSRCSSRSRIDLVPGGPFDYGDVIPNLQPAIALLNFLPRTTLDAVDIYLNELQGGPHEASVAR